MGGGILKLVAWAIRRAPAVMNRQDTIVMAFILVIVGGIMLCTSEPPDSVWFGPVIGWPWAVIILVRRFKRQEP